MATNTAQVDSQPQFAARPRRRAVVGIVLVLLVCGAVLYYAPTIVALTPLRQQIIPTLAPKFNGSSVVDSASLGWFVPVVLYDVETFDAEGRPLLKAAAVTSENTLLALALDTQRPGHFRLDQPRGQVRLRSGGSNIEDVVAPFLEPDEGKSSLELAIEIVDGEIDVVDETATTVWRLEGIAGLVDVPAPSKPISVKLQAKVATAAGKQGRLRCEASWQAQPAGPGVAMIALVAESLPLEIMDPVRDRLPIDMQLAGGLTGESRIEWNGEQGSYLVEIEQLHAEQFVFAADSWLGNDVVRFDRLAVSGGATLVGGRLTVEKLKCDSAPANFTLDGTVAIDQLTAERFVDTLLANDLATSGRVDLAQLSQILPGTLHIREGTTIKSGRVSWDLASRQDGERRRLVGRLDTSNLSADAAGTPITWAEPVQITLALQQSPQGPLFETLECRSSFLQVAGSGTPAEANLTADCDLDRLAAELGRFVDFGSVQLAGKLSANVDWRQIEDGRFAAGGTAHVEELAVEFPGWRIGGAADVTARGRFSLDEYAVDTAAADLKQLVVSGGGMNIVEPVVKIEATNLVYRPEAAQLAADMATLTSSALAFRADQFVLDAASESSAKLAGKIAFRSDLARLTGWFQDPADPPVTQLFGEATGNVDMVYSAGVTSAAVNASVANFTVAERPSMAGQPGKPLWREPDLRLAGRGRYEQQTGKVRFENLAVSSNALRVAAAGEVSDLTGRLQTDVAGEISYDLAALAAVLSPHLGTNVELVGQKTERFAVQGPVFLPAGAATSDANAPLVSPELTAQTAVSWDAAAAYELVAGAGRLQLQLARGVVNLSALDVPVSGGRVKLASHLLLDRHPPMLVVEPGPVVQNVKITPEMCRTWLKYVAPVLANSTRAEGTFSTQLAHAKVPLTAPLTSDVKGTLSVHTAGVGPGPLGRELLLIAKRLQAVVARRPLEGLAVATDPWLVLPQQEIEFQVVDGRVHHRNFEMALGDVAVRTEGSVGFDQTMALTAVVPVRDEWTSLAVFSTMKGQSLVIPIGGTLNKPKFDGRALEEIGGKMFQGAAQKFLNDELRNNLKRLFGPRD